jgi:hypothetical protein
MLDKTDKMKIIVVHKIDKIVVVLYPRKIKINLIFNRHKVI